MAAEEPGREALVEVVHRIIEDFGRDYRAKVENRDVLARRIATALIAAALAPGRADGAPERLRWARAIVDHCTHVDAMALSRNALYTPGACALCISAALARAREATP